MKKYFLIYITFIFVSCSNDLESLNVDVKNATSAPAEAFFNQALKNMSDVESDLTYGGTASPMTLGRIWSQQISSVTYNEGSRYFMSSNWNDVYMGVLINLDQSTKVIENTEQTSINQVALQNQLSIIEILRVYAFSKLVEGFGDIPYSEGLDVKNISPAYDKAETIYLDLLTRLNTALDNMDESGASWGQDLMYHGNARLWKKFGRSLQLQMGMRIADSNPQVAENNIIAALPEVFTSNADNAEVDHLSAQPNTSQLYLDLAVGNRKDFVGSKPFVDYMNNLDDPRRSVFFKSVNGNYVGAPTGKVVDYASYSEMGTLFYQPETAVIFIDYATVEFLLAEAAERNMGGVVDAELHYNNAIKASFEYYNIGGVDDYLLNPEVAYATAPGDWKEKIGMQKWVALYNQGFEAWTEYRRLDYPKLSAPGDAYVNIVPVRLIYPISEQTLNRSNYEAASAAIGGDLLTTKLFWDKY
ncbi:MAG: SusD/RagB family nutrient-binding outer membrane lipoprotein [Gelidibacter sp.]